MARFLAANNFWLVKGDRTEVLMPVGHHSDQSSTIETTYHIEARVAERERIARELHDTLLQSVQGLILRFDHIARPTAEHSPTRPLMDDALALATEVLEEGRDKVGSLRGSGRPCRHAGRDWPAPGRPVFGALRTDSQRAALRLAPGRARRAAVDRAPEPAAMPSPERVATMCLESKRDESQQVCQPHASSSISNYLVDPPKKIGGSRKKIARLCWHYLAVAKRSCQNR